MATCQAHFTFRFLDHRLELLHRHLRVAELGGTLGGEALEFGPELGAAGVAIAPRVSVLPVLPLRALGGTAWDAAAAPRLLSHHHPPRRLHHRHVWNCPLRLVHPWQYVLPLSARHHRHGRRSGHLLREPVGVVLIPGITGFRLNFSLQFPLNMS